MSHGGKIKDIAKEKGQDATNFIDFSSNLNIFSPSIPSSEWMSFQQNVETYPDCEKRFFEKQLSRIYSIDEKYILPTAGGIEAISLILQCFNQHECHLFYPTFNAYRELCLINKIAPIYHHATAENNFSDLNLGCLPHKKQIAILCNPSNPTGHLVSKDRLLKAINENKETIWIVDEAFIEFTGKPEESTLIGDLPQLNNLVLIRSLTKSWNIPGLRLGFLACSNSCILKQATKKQLPWSINGITIAWAERFLNEQDHELIKQSIQRYQPIKRVFENELRQFNWLRIFRSSTNFFLLKITDSKVKIDSIFDFLADQKLIIRQLGKGEGFESKSYFRIAIRSTNDNNQMIAALRAFQSKYLT